jgi:hypothetical protein
MLKQESVAAAKREIIELKHGQDYNLLVDVACSD